MSITREKLEIKLEDLWASYKKASFRQRLKVIQDRIKYPDCGPNLFLSRMSAIEALARVFLVELLVKCNKEDRDQLYEKYRWKNADMLFKEILKIKNIYKKHEAHYEYLKIAVKYRNLLTHECSFLNQGQMKTLIQKIDIIIQILNDLASEEKLIQ